jgi:hypothetical protein
MGNWGDSRNELKVPPPDEALIACSKQFRSS